LKKDDDSPVEDSDWVSSTIKSPAEVSKVTMMYTKEDGLLHAVKFEDKDSKCLMQTKAFENAQLRKQDNIRIYSFSLEPEERIVGVRSTSQNLEMAQHFNF